MVKQAPRHYIISAGQTRILFIASSVLMVTTLVGILLLASSRPRGEFTVLDRSQYQSTLESATQDLQGYLQHADGRISIPIERAMELVVERGVVNPFASE